MGSDFRRDWVKSKVTKFFGLSSDRYFEEMLANTDDLEDKLASYLDDDFMYQEENKRFFYVYKTSYEKLIEEEIMVAEKVIKPEVLEDEAVQIAPSKKKKGKGKKEKGKKKEKSKSDTESPAPISDAEGTDASPSDAENAPEIVNGTTVEPESKVESPVNEEVGNTESQATETEASTLPSPEVTDVEDIDGSPREAKGKKKGKKEKGKGKQKKKKPPVEVIEEPPVVEEEEYVYVPQIIQKLVTDFELHGGFIKVHECDIDPDRRILYMYRKTEEGIPNFDLPEQAEAEMPNYFLIGMTTGNFLHSITTISKNLFMPLFQKSFMEPNVKKITATNNNKKQPVEKVDFKLQSDSAKFSLRSQPSRFDDRTIHPDEKENLDTSTTPIRGELMTEVEGLMSALDWVSDHVEDELDLPMTDLTDILYSNRTDEELIRDPNVILNLEEVVMGWERHILKLIESYLAKTPAGNGPLLEYEYWHDRETAFSSIVEQLKKPTLIRISNILEMAKSPVIDGFIHYQVDLKRHYMEAKDNVKFLSTIKRHLKTITYSTDFRKVINSIPLLIDGLHLIWVLSRYYNSDEVMVPFMEKIAWCLLDKVRKTLHNENLFRKPITEVQRLTSDTQEMLELWKSTYMDTRQKIEDSGKGERWEFDRKRLFAASDYMATVCKDLYEVATVIYHFKNIFGAELRAIVSDPQSIDNVAKRVDRLVIQIENTDFDIFDANSKENWEAIMELFRKEVRKLELEGVNFIDQSFKMIRSSESALEMLLKFKHIETRQLIQNKLMLKFDVILDQYMKELLAVEDHFTRNKRHPVLCRNMPPHGGAIYWVRLLYFKLKRPILKFQKVEELMKSHMKRQVFSTYLKLAKELKAYEQSKLEEWLEMFAPAMERAMQMDILKLNYSNKKKDAKPLKVGISGTGSFSKGPSLHKSPKIPRASSKTSSSKSVTTIMDRITARHLTWHEIMGDSTIADMGMQFDLNFDNNLWSCFQSVEILETLQFNLPENIRLVAIRKEKLQKSVNLVESMIKLYNDLIDKLNEAQVKFLKDMNIHCLHISNVHGVVLKCITVFNGMIQHGKIMVIGNTRFTVHNSCDNSAVWPKFESKGLLGSQKISTTNLAGDFLFSLVLPNSPDLFKKLIGLEHSWLIVI